jgi:hypothetical protein
VDVRISRGIGLTNEQVYLSQPVARCGNVLPHAYDAALHIFAKRAAERDQILEDAVTDCIRVGLQPVIVIPGPG